MRWRFCDWPNAAIETSAAARANLKVAGQRATPPTLRSTFNSGKLFTANPFDPIRRDLHWIAITPELSSDFGQTVSHGRPRRVVIQKMNRLGGNPLRGHLMLDQFRHDAPPGHQIRNGQKRRPDQPSPYYPT